jgi:probable addiction module antidote protein
MAARSKKSQLFEPAKYLDSEEAIVEYLTEALQSGDAALIAHAVGVAAKACAARASSGRQ